MVLGPLICRTDGRFLVVFYFSSCRSLTAGLVWVIGPLTCRIGQWFFVLFSFVLPIPPPLGAGGDLGTFVGRTVVLWYCGTGLCDFGFYL